MPIHSFSPFVLAFFFHPVAYQFDRETESKSECGAFPPCLFTKRNNHHSKAEQACHDR